MAFPRRLSFLSVVMAVLLLLDQASKAWVRNELPLHRASPLIPNLIDLTHVQNRGVSFSVMGDLADHIRVPLLVGISVVAVVLITWFWLHHRRTMPLLNELAFVLILPGAVGNLIDRLFFGTVTDFLHFRFYSTSFFVNNLADIFISLGVVAYALGVLLQPRHAPES